jgi:AAA domain/TrwC relaxase
VNGWNVPGVQYSHDANRALEPNYHDHLIIWNASKSAVNGKLYTIEFAEFMNQSPYLTKVFWDEIARAAKADGFNIVQGQYGQPEIAELMELAQKHQIRSDEIEALVASVEEYAGTKLSDREVAVIVRASRGLDLDDFKRQWDSRKVELDGLKDLDPDTAETSRRKMIETFLGIVRDCCESNLLPTSTVEVRAIQQGKVTPEEMALMEALKSCSVKITESVPTLELSISFAIEHLFQQKSVVKDYELYSAGLVHAQGAGVDLAEMRRKVAADPRVIFGKHNEVACADHYRKELEVKLWIGEGKGKGVALKYNADFTSRNLSKAQRGVVDSLLESKDQFSALSGTSGVGKTYALADIIKANLAAGHHVAVCAPSDAARDVLMREGKELGYSAEAKTLAGAVSLQRHQADPRLHGKLGKGDLLIIDEASMVSLAQGHLELERARKGGYRVQFVGDLDQGKSIEAGDFFRLVISAGIHTAQLHDIRRQSETALNFHYRVAVQLMKKGKTTAGFKELLQAGCVHEVQGQARIEAIADKLLEREAAGIPTMLANLSHRENDLIASAIRRKMDLKDERQLTVCSTLGWSDAQKKEFSKLRRCSSIVSLDGMVLELTRGKDKGEQWFVLKGDTGKGSISARTRDGRFRKFTASDYKAFDVCESKSIPVAIGDRLFARSSNRRGNIINGEELSRAGTLRVTREIRTGAASNTATSATPTRPQVTKFRDRRK